VPTSRGVELAKTRPDAREVACGAWLAYAPGGGTRSPRGIPPCREPGVPGPTLRGVPRSCHLGGSECPVSLKGDIRGTGMPGGRQSSGSRTRPRPSPPRQWSDTTLRGQRCLEEASSIPARLTRRPRLAYILAHKPWRHRHPRLRSIGGGGRRRPHIGTREGGPA
jgi:hypothetical protein